MAFAALTGPGLTQASGETGTGSQQTTFTAMEQFMGIMTDPFMNRGGGGYSSPSSGYAERDAYAARSNPTDAFAMFNKAPLAPAYEPRWSVWAAAMAVRNRPRAMRSSVRTTPRAALLAPRSAPTI